MPVKRIIIGAGILLIVIAGVLLILQLWFNLFDAEIFLKLVITLGTLGGVLFLGGLLYHEYSENKRNRDKNLLS